MLLHKRHDYVHEGENVEETQRIALELVGKLSRQGIEDHQLVTEFNESTIEQKEAFSILKGDRPHFGGRTLLQLLLRYDPCILDLEEPWVETLIAAEQNIKDDKHCTVLTHLLDSQKLAECNHHGEHFITMMRNHIEKADIDGRTVLMHLSLNNR